MGRFVYNTSERADFDDRLLAHLELVINKKLRRGEPFLFTWREDASLGSGRTSLWVAPSSSLVFKYFGSRMPQINRHWLEALALAANSPRGLRAVPEPAPAERTEEERVAFAI